MAAGESCTLFLVCLITLTFNLVSTCGVTTHIEIAHRALEHFQSVNDKVRTNYEQLLRKHPDAFQGGAPYPDAYYPDICFSGKYHGIAEDSHWAPFMNATINYIRHHFPPPWDEGTEKLVVFLFGFASHQVADVSWHSLGIDQGFLTTMAKINFHDVYNTAHPIGDFGGDILSQYELNLSYVGEVGEWYIPVLDLVGIYKEFYGRQEISVDVIVGCTLLLYLERLGEDVAVAELYLDYAKKSPYLVDRFEDYFLGGVDDMAAQTQNTWQRVGLMLEHGTSACSIPHNPLYISCGQNRSSVTEGKMVRNGQFIRPRLAVKGVNSDNVRVTRKWRGITLKPSEKHLELRKNLISLVRTKVSPAKSSATNVQATYTFSQQYSKFGWSLASGDVNNDGYADLIAGAPGWGSMGSIQQGRVFIIFGTKDGLPMNTSGDTQTVNGPHKGQSKFGASVAAVDVNLDGITDLVVGAPSFSNNNTHIDYNGKVYIYFGSSLGIVDSPNMTVSCKSRYCNLGLTLTVGDLNGDDHADLLIGSPYAPGGGQQRGLVGGLYSSKKYTASETINLQIEQLDWIKFGDQDYGWFGESFVIRNSWIVIGQPVFRICAMKDCQYSQNDRQSVGKVHIFRASPKGPVLTTTLTGSDVFGQFGTGLSIGRPFDTVTDVLAVSSVSSNVSGKYYGIRDTVSQAGEVHLYNLTQVGAGGDSSSGQVLSPVTTFSGNRRFGRFGAKILFSDLRRSGFEDLIITSPLYSRDISDLIGPEAEQGRVFVYNGGTGFPRGDATATKCQGDIQPCPEEKADVFLLFNNDEGRARFGSSVTEVSGTKQTLLAVGAPHSSVQSVHMQGAVGILNFPVDHHFSIKG